MANNVPYPGSSGQLDLLKNVLLNITSKRSTMFHAFRWLYEWDNHPEELAKHLEEIPNFGKSIFDNKQKKFIDKKLKYYFTNEDIQKIRSMKTDKKKLLGFNSSFYYKLIRYGSNSCRLASPSNSVWSNKCLSNSRLELEYLLFLIKEDENNDDTKTLGSIEGRIENVNNYYDLLCQRLCSIIQQAGTRTGVNQMDIDVIYSKIREEIETIRYQTDIRTFDKTKIIEFIRENDLESRYLKDLKRSFNEELKNYSPPKGLLKSDGTKFDINEILNVVNTQVIIICAKAGYGKTSLTKYIYYQWLSRNIIAIRDLHSYDLVLRFSFRNGDLKKVSKFLEGELPNLRENLTSSSRLKELIDNFKILFIVDGTISEYRVFLKSLFKNLPEKHKVLITTRPDTLDEVKKIVGEKSESNISIQCLTQEQIEEISDNFLNDVQSFSAFYQSLDFNWKELVGIPANLIHCLELWTQDSVLLNGKFALHRLYETLICKQIELVIARHEDKTDICHDFKSNVKRWFDKGLCKMAVDSVFQHRMMLKKVEEIELCEYALVCNLTAADCLSTFLNSEMTCTGLTYYYRHNIQQEVLASFYLKNCDIDVLIRIVEEVEKNSYLKKKNPTDYFNFIFEFCYCFQFSRIFAIFLKTHCKLQRAEYLIEIRKRDEEFFNDLKKELGSWDQPLVLHIFTQQFPGYKPEDLKNAIEYLSSDIYQFKLIIYIDNAWQIGNFRNINAIINIYKEHLTFDLTLKIFIEDNIVSVINKFKEAENEKLIKEIVFSSSHWQEDTSEEIFSLENLEMLSFHVDGNDHAYHKSFLRHLASSNTVDLFHKTCHVHFIIDLIELDTAEVILDLLMVNQKFKSVSVYFDLWLGYDGSNIDLCGDLLSNFMTSSVEVKELIMKFGIVSSDCKCLQLLNCVNIEKFQLQLCYFEDKNENETGRSMTPLSTLKGLFDIWKMQDQRKLKEIHFKILSPDQLKTLYDKISTDVIGATTVEICFVEKEYQFYTVANVPQFTGKMFKKIMMPPLNLITAEEECETIEALKAITAILDVGSGRIQKL